MDWWLVLTWIGVVILFALGILGIVIPALPGVGFIFAGTLLYAIVTGFEVISGWIIFLFAVMTGAAIAADYAAGILGAKKYNASKYGIIGSIVGLIVGFFFSIPGIILGPLVGAVVFEMIGGRDSRDAMRAGWGTFVGFIGGMVFKVVVGLSMIGIFFFYIFTA